MIILDRLDEIRKRHNKELRTLLMDILRALASPDMDIRKKTLDIALDLVAPSNIEEVIASLKREIAKTQVQGFEKVCGSHVQAGPNGRISFSRTNFFRDLNTASCSYRQFINAQ